MPRGGWVGNRLTRNERFDRRYRVDESGCWIWTGAIDKDGYGKCGWESDRAHRFSFKRFIGPIPSGHCVCHRCDVPSCVNPAHLFIGTPAENTEDMIRKGRHARGPGIRPDFIPMEKAIAIRADVLNGSFHADVSKKYGVSMGSVHNIVHRKSWHFRDAA